MEATGQGRTLHPMSPLRESRDRIAGVLRERRVPEEARQIFGGFKQFVLRGNVVDLAVGIIIGASFNAVVNALVRGLITPLISAIGSQPDFSALTFTVNGSIFRYGDVLNALISFLIQAVVIYFAIIVPLNALTRRERKAPVPSDPTTKKCPECLSEIPIAARRCRYCAEIQHDIGGMREPIRDLRPD